MSLLGKSKGRVITKVQFQRIVQQFITFAKRELKITQDVPIYFIDDSNFAKNISSFGEISSENIIQISIINRHPMDVLRTLAHELEHYKQHIIRGVPKKRSSSAAGSRTEDEANAVAGELMRKFGIMYPKYFEFTSIK